MVFQCDICEKKFKRNYNLTQHKEKVHSKEVRRVMCSLCKKKQLFSTITNLRVHKKRFHANKKLTKKQRKLVWVTIKNPGKFGIILESLQKLKLYIIFLYTYADSKPKQT